MGRFLKKWATKKKFADHCECKNSNIFEKQKVKSKSVFSVPHHPKHPKNVKVIQLSSCTFRQKSRPRAKVTKIGTAIKETLGNKAPLSELESDGSFERFFFLAEPIFEILFIFPMKPIQIDIPDRRCLRFLV